MTDVTPTRTLSDQSARDRKRIAKVTGTPGDDQFVQIPRVDDTKRYAKFCTENDGNGNGRPFGAFYVPLEDAPADVVAVRITFVRK